jgi:hypothetical protein
VQAILKIPACAVLFAKKSQYLLEYTFPVSGKKAPVGMLSPVLHVELVFESFNELLPVFALEPAKKSALPFSSFAQRESGVFVYDGPFDGTIEQISEFVPEVFQTFQTDDRLAFYNFNRQVNEPDH